MKAQLQRTSYDLNFIPYDSLSAEALNKIRAGEVVECSFKKMRNPQFHRKFFALINLVFERQKKYEVLEDFLTEIKLKIGHYREHVTTKGVLIYVPKSISFNKCDEIEFRKIYSKTIDVCLAHFITGTPEEIEQMVNEVISFD